MKNIKNIIFDYGNVIFEINFNIAQSTLIQLGISDIESFFGHKKQNEIFNIFEVGACTAAQFRDEIRQTTQNFELSDAQIDSAWNSLLIGVPDNDVHKTLLEVKKKYRTFLLSNNNEIHYNWILKHLKEKFNLNGLDSFFEKTYLSHLMQMRKPNEEIFKFVMRENNLIPEETLFIDDSPQHLEGAKKIGLHTL
ncbi:MAG: HAD family phosphatase, partial [Sphingobacteriaceae bacterium]|nr:HAD family phosphatase [Sphingobacteriaceae bacterium]